MGTISVEEVKIVFINFERTLTQNGKLLERTYREGFKYCRYGDAEF